MDQLKPEQTSGACGQVVTLATREGAETTYSLAGPPNSADAALVLLARPRPTAAAAFSTSIRTGVRAD